MNTHSKSPVPRRVLHVLGVSWPHLNGYTIRSRNLIEAQASSGLSSPAVATSPFYPGNSAAIHDEHFNGIHYRRVPHPVDDENIVPPLDWVAGGLHSLARWSAIMGKRFAATNPDGTSRHQPENAKPGGTAQLPEGHTKPAPRGVGRRFAARLWASRPAVRERLEDLENELLMRRFRRHLSAIVASEGSGLVHVHSPYKVALPAIDAARRAGIPVVYEVRGIWEESAVSSGYFERHDRRYRRWRAAETGAMREADAVVCICETLKAEVVSRGIPEEKVFVVPNAVGEDLLDIASKNTNQMLSEHAGIQKTRHHLRPFVMGYVGSVRPMEGIEELVRAGAELARRGRDVSVLVVGDGDTGPLKELATDFGIEDRLLLTGKVPHDHIAAYYSLIDVFVVSRPDEPVTRMVTPLKPLEAMAFGRAIVVSDLPALREIVINGETGLVYPAGNPGALADACERLLSDPAERQRLADRGRRWVMRNRRWSSVVQGYDRVYAAVGCG